MKKKDELSEKEIYKSIRKKIPPPTKAISDKRDKLEQEQFQKDLHADLYKMKNNNNPVKVRFAPSPTGHLHVGGARTALYNWLFARNIGGSFVLRIEDTDRARSTEEAIDGILTSMKWLGLDWDEGPYHQMDRLQLYHKDAEELISKGKAYYCYCLPEELAARRKSALKQNRDPGYDRRCLNLTDAEINDYKKEGREPSLRFKMPDEGETVVSDLIRGEVVFENSLLNDFILLRSDGIPTYNFAAVVDDGKMEITHVIRGEDHLSNTPKQILLYEELGYKIPQFVHLPIILGKDKAPLSKRHGDTAVEEFKANGYLPEALINYLALLGWSFDDATTLFSIDELIAKFSLKKVSKSAAVFDLEKLDWMNGHYIRQMPVAELTQKCIPFMEKAGLLDKKEDVDSNELNRLEKMVSMRQERMKTLSEVTDGLEIFFDKQFHYDEIAISKVLRKEGVKEILEKVYDVIKNTKDWSHGVIEINLRQLQQDMDLKPRVIFQVIRVATTGTMVSPPLFETLELLGKDMVLSHIETTKHLIE